RSPEDFFVRKLWLQNHLGAIDAFTCPSRFMLDHYADWGLARDKLFHVTNGQRDYAAADDQPVQARQEARETYNRFGFFGQIIDAKGVHIILRAVALLRAEGFTDFTVEINGDNLNYASPEVRAASEPGLWQRLAGALPAPPAREVMVDGFRRIYRAQGDRTEAATVASDPGHDRAAAPTLRAHEKVPNARRAKARLRSTQPVMS